MPIYHKTPLTGNSNATEIDNHTSEAAKVKRTREQAYFNSYDFDAIEVLPYPNDDDDDDDDHHKNKYKRELVQQQQQQEAKNTMRPTFSHQQQHQHPHHIINMEPALSHSLNNASTSGDSFIDVACHQQQHQQQQIVINNMNFSTKYKPTAYLQRIAGLFQPKTSKTSKTLEHNLESVIIDGGHSNQKQHSTTEGQLYGGGNRVGIAQQSLSNTTTASRDRDRDREAPYDYVMDATRAPNGVTNKSADTVAKAAAVDALCSNVANGGTIVSNNAAAASGGGNFLLPRLILKYQSSTLMPTGVAAATAVATATASASTGTATTTSKINSMPLATHNNSNHSTAIHQQQKQHGSEAFSADEAHQCNSNMAANVKGSEGGVGVATPALRHKKTSLSSSLNSSMNFEELQEDEEEEKSKQLKSLQEEPKVLPKTLHINPLKISARASSHQSHYSTDKSASSGYYSSNMCSTYSMEEHIYSEPTLDLKKLKHQPLKESQQDKQQPQTISDATTLKATTLKRQQLQQQPQPNTNSSLTLEPFSVMRTVDCSRRYRFADNINDLNGLPTSSLHTLHNKSPAFNENLKILESSIENLDRHLKTFPNLNNAPEGYSTQADKQRHLPTIQEAFDSLKKPSWPPDNRSDDSLMDIDLDSFLLDKDKTSQAKALDKGLDNATFLPEDQEENHYKCAKYINSCPEDAYRVESDILAPARSSISGQSAAVSVDLYPKRYEEQLHFENTRELLEDVRDKIRLLTQSQEAVGTQQPSLNSPKQQEYLPQELHTMINTLKRELELYLARMNQHSEQEIRQLCSGLVKNHNIVKMKNAFERRRSLSEANDVYATYEAIQDGIVLSNQGIPISIRQQITSIRCSSDPNFKMKRKSITEVFPMAECYVESIQTGEELPTTTTQLQKNLSFHKPVLEQLSSCSNAAATAKNKTPSSAGDNSDSNDKESILDWHRKKPSIWEMYYGTNRIQQSLLGVKKNGMMLTSTTTAASSPSTMCYPSSRPESDFTLDLPRAEQLRIKMEKEKKFRQRCRLITTFLSLVFFLLTVMVVSLVLTRGKRMFGSMI